MSSQNKWGPILNDITNIQDVASLLGSSEMWSWIGASVMCWKGTEPVKTTVEFYLINYKRGLKLDEKIKDLNYLTSLYNLDKNVAVEVHGGYQANVLRTNKEIFNNGVIKKRKESNSIEGQLQGFKTFADDENLEAGTLEIQFGHKMSMRQMLIARLDVTPSLVEVKSISPAHKGDKPEPLYYKVSLGLIGSRPLLSTDVDVMYQELAEY